MGKPRLISFKLCPFVQRSVILLKEKSVEYDIDFIDVYDPPAWFLELSPTGKVPVMQVGETVLFESSIISEYIDEVYPPSIHPEDPLRKAQIRAWVEYTSPLYSGIFNLIMSKTKEEVDPVLEEFSKNLAGLEKEKTSEPWFNGDAFSMMDIAIAPFFVRASFLKDKCDVDLLAPHKKLQEWSEIVLSRQSVIDSTPEGHAQMLLMRMEKMGSYLLASK